jgi:hypothetical protein
MESLIDIAKRAVATGSTSMTRQAVLAEIDNIVAKRRQLYQSHSQAYARFLETDDGRDLYRLSKIAQHEQPAEFEQIQKAQSDAVGLQDTATERLGKRCLAMKAEKPFMPEDDIISHVLSVNPELAAATRLRKTDRRASAARLCHTIGSAKTRLAIMCGFRSVDLVSALAPSTSPGQVWAAS